MPCCKVRQDNVGGLKVYRIGLRVPYALSTFISNVPCSVRSLLRKAWFLMPDKVPAAKVVFS